jgi:hypothetical protein
MHGSRRHLTSPPVVGAKLQDASSCPGEQYETLPDDPERGGRTRSVNRRIDTALLPFLSILYLFNGLDRSNIGNAETQGAFCFSQGSFATHPTLRLHLGYSTEIGASQDDFNLATSLFFVTFVLLQPPSAAIGRWLGAKHWVAVMMVRLPIKLGSAL